MALNSVAPDPAEQAEALAVLGNRERLEILWAVWEGEEPVAFSTIRERTAFEDHGRLNYHLDQLAEFFVERTESGVELRPVAHKALSTIFTATVLESGSVERTPVDSDCFVCGSALAFSYRNHDARVGCQGCGLMYTQAYLSLASPDDRPVEELLVPVAERHRYECRCSGRGVCPHCRGPMSSRLHAGEFCGETGAMVANRCEHCGTTYDTPLGGTVLHVPRVVAFNYEHGVDVEARHPWELDFLHDLELVTVRGPLEDPDGARLSIPRDGATLLAEFDASGAVAGFDRR